MRIHGREEDREMEAKGQRGKRKRKGVLGLRKKTSVLPLQTLTWRQSPRGNQVQHPSWEY